VFRLRTSGAGLATYAVELPVQLADEARVRA